MSDLAITARCWRDLGAIPDDEGEHIVQVFAAFDVPEDGGVWDSLYLVGPIPWPGEWPPPPALRRQRRRR